jgi:ubiquinone/menaquinone biosynthesis C-methylase UbiE
MDYDDLAGGYAQHRADERAVLDALADGVEHSSHVLEVGCGTGNYAIAVHERTGARCVGVDPSTAMLERARARSGAVEVVRGSAEALPFADEEFDLVFSVDVIHHVVDRAAYYAEALRVLRPGGRVCTVTQDEAMIRARWFRPYFPDIVEVERRRYPTPKTLAREMTAAGFTHRGEQRVDSPVLVRDADACRAKAFSSLLLIPDDAFAEGLARLERDLRTGPIAARAHALLLWARRI